MKSHIRLALLTLVYATLHSRAKILRNNALMSKMVSHFQQDNNLSLGNQGRERRKIEENVENSEQRNDKQDMTPDSQKPEKILNLMQNVLCRNFPSIPCKIIMQDHALNKLIQRSIQQITYKKMRMDKTTQSSYNSPTLFPIINSEDLSNFLEVSNTGYFNEKPTEKHKPKKKKKSSIDRKLKNHWSQEKPSKKKIKGRKGKDNKRATELNGGRKKMRKFYPHKIKYKDKNSNSHNNQGEFRDYTEEKGSMSLELPEMNGGGPQTAPKQEMSYKMDGNIGNDSPVWRIDYMKHGVPSLNMFGFEDERLRGKLIKSGPNTVVDENGLEQPLVRKEVLHPDVYIKKNFVRKNAAVINSDVMD